MNIAAAKTAAPALRAPFPYWHELSLGILLIAGLATASALDPRFTQPSVQIEQAGDLWPLAFVSIAMAMIVITGGIDLSVGAMTGLAVVVIGLASEAGMSFSVSMVLGLATSVAAGFLNGFFVAKLAIHPLIVTLATMAGYRGIALALTRGRTIESIPADYAQAIQGVYGGLPLPLWCLLGTVAATALFLSKSPYGRFLYAIGHNETAARYSGIPVARIKMALYSISGLACGVAAILITSRYEQAKADFGTALELKAITVVVLGGISIFGGRGNIAGLLLGLVLLHECNKFVPWYWDISELNALVTGGVLVGAVLLNSVLSRRQRSG